jgi:hypothetical protein
MILLKTVGVNPRIITIDKEDNGLRVLRVTNVRTDEVMSVTLDVEELRELRLLCEISLGEVDRG